jgi:DNA polymerase-3 subunit delta'
VFILGDAERLVVQESSQEAANALLKVLEEPPADTTIIVTAADPHALLPTIRSRLVAIRIPRLKADEVRAFLKAEIQPPLTGAALERRVLLAEGCIGRTHGTGEGSQGTDRAADKLLQAVRDGDQSWLPMALAQPTWAARGDFTGMLDALALKLREELQQEARSGSPAIAGRLRAIKRVEETREAAQGNANPQLALAILAADLETLL